MSERFHDKYRIPSARLRNWDYGWNAMYFVTICTQIHDCYFGDIISNDMILSEIGSFAHQNWNNIPNQFPYVELDVFVVMPNHIHGIIVINKMDDEHPGTIGRDAIGTIGRDAINRVSTKPEPESQPQPENNINGGITGIHNPMLHDNLSRIIRWYKGRVSFESHKINAGFDWQPRFHEHIIRNDESYQRISEYIQNNPANWHDDKFYNRTES